MAHPVGNQLRNDKVQHARVADITKACGGGGMASGGHADEAQDKSLVRKMVKGSALRATGGGVKVRADRPSRARGGRLKKGKGHTVNVIVAPHAPAPPTPPVVPGVGAPPPMAAKPPMMPPPGPGPGGPPPGLGSSPGGPPLPPGVPPPGMRYAGGRTRKTGGKVEANEKPHKGAFTTKGKPADATVGNLANSQSAGIGKGRTAMQNTGTNKQDTKNIGRGPVITKATGGPITSKYGWEDGMAPSFGGGGGGGKAKKGKAHHAAKIGYGSSTVKAQNPTRDPAA